MLPCTMFTLSPEGLSSNSSRSPGLSLFRSSSPSPRSAAALAPQFFPSLCTGGSSDPRLSLTRPFLHRPFTTSSCFLTEQNESKKRPLFSYSYKRTNLQPLYYYIFTKMGGVFSSNFHLHPKGCRYLTISLLRYFDFLLWNKSLAPTSSQVQR